MSSVVKLQDKTAKTPRNLLDKINIIDNEAVPIGGTQPLKTMLLSELGLLPTGGTTGQFLKKTSETDFDIEWGEGGGSGGSGVSVTTNIVRVEPNAEEVVVGKLYLTYADALAYVLLQTPSGINPWVIELPSGEFDEDIEFNQYVNILGHRTYLTGTISSVYYYGGSLLNNTTYIEDCIITKIDLSNDSGVPLIFSNKCFYNVSSYTSPVISGGIINRNCLIIDGDFSINTLFFNYSCMVLGGTFSEYMESMGHALRCEHCQLYGGTFSGGNFILCNISSDLGSTVTINGGIYNYDNCVFYIDDNVDINIDSDTNVFNNCSFNNDGETPNNITFSESVGNVATFNNCYFENMDVTHESVVVSGTLNLNNCSGALTFVGDSGNLIKVCKDCFYDTSVKVSDSTGIQYQVTNDGNYIYICTATDTWKRILLDAIPPA